MNILIASTEVEAEVLDKLKYIEETKETMDENTKKLAEIVRDIDGIEKGEIKGVIFGELSAASIIHISGTCDAISRSVSSSLCVFPVRSPVGSLRQNLEAPCLHPGGG